MSKPVRNERTRWAEVPWVKAWGMMGPYAGVAIRLEFLPHQQAFRAAEILATLACLVDPPRNAGQQLDVVTHFVGDDVGFRKFAATAQARCHFMMSYPACRQAHG